MALPPTQFRRAQTNSDGPLSTVSQESDSRRFLQHPKLGSSFCGFFCPRIWAQYVESSSSLFSLPYIRFSRMAERPTTANSGISSAISDDLDLTRPPSSLNPLPSISQPPQHGYSHASTPFQSRRPTPHGSVHGGRSTASSSRPQSPTSQIGRTHVPSLTAHGFSKPMSSLRLQAQRLARPSTARTGPSVATDETPDDAEILTRASMSTVRHGPYAPLPEHERAPPSRGSEFTNPAIPERPTNASPTGNTTTRSLGDHVRLLNERAAQQKAESHPRPPHLNIIKNGGSHDAPPKSPMSFASGLSLSSKRRQEGHQPLSSSENSPRETRDAPLPQNLEQEYNLKDLRNPGLGRNYEYFQGNTVFSLGGRVQNSRDRPVNIATGILLVVPAILFFVFS